MKNFKLNKVFLFIIIFNFLSGCGYQPLFNAENQKFSIKKFELEGNKRLGSLLKNNLITSSKEGNNLTITIKASKKNVIANKSDTGKVLEYSVSLNFEITATEYEKKEIVLSGVYSREQNYLAAEVHLDTLNSEKKAMENMIETIANEILISLTSIYQNK